MVIMADNLLNRLVGQPRNEKQEAVGGGDNQ